MGNKRLILEAALIVVICGVLVWLLMFPHEPVREGKPLSEWLAQYGTNHLSRLNRAQEEQAQTVLLQVGVKGIPVYLRLLSSRPSSLKTNILNKLSPAWRIRLNLPAPADYDRIFAHRRNLGTYGLLALDTNARPAIPYLIALLNDRNADVRHAAVYVLAELGPLSREVLPALIKCLKDPDSLIRLDAAWALGYIHADAADCVPALVEFLEKNRNKQILRDTAMEALGQFGARATPAVPALRSFLNHADADARETATNVLKEINPPDARTAKK